ncbi:hypothetical protein COH20_011263 [Aspergillus flavus]|nr:uncharacterized protein G4B84_000974 [Aspergillus flavus NRRL3357]KAJ1717050.1 fungal-specific transcription factor domain-containing protein [Aspergillus flavus]OOO12613.1 hypothetical protein OAory_01003620 [Aspergillus oryzae]QMW25729.1 hypothetical protein G4B84_000974 [Aspergillus flavus NRRL3357]QMW37812.1 hypothetical protein G4B11_001048 [Aspergillus flavus]RAQ65910.1 hypothetical protein COH20_011263 [Aspergillus flavus]
MESRIERMESILAASGLSSEAATPATTGTSADLDDQLSMLLLHDEGSSTFIGSASSLSIFSPAGLQWISSRTNSSDLSDLILRRIQACPPLHESMRLWHGLDYRGQVSLPPKHVADSFVTYFFDTLNDVIPLYRRDTFEALYEQQYTSCPPKSTSWYASLNVVLALGCLLSHEESMNESTESSMRAPTTAVDYLRNCWNVFGELSLSCRDLMAVQALLAMALTTEILLDKEATYIALGAAVRVATSLGLQQQLKDPRLSPPEISERYIIFWCMYSLDKSLSLRLGRPPAIDDRDIEIDIPDERQLAVTNPRTAVLLLAHMKLSRIASEVYSELYSARSRRYPALKRFRTISELDTKLQEWCRSLPGDVQPGKPIVCTKENVRHAITLHLEYFNCLATLHRCWAFQDQLTEYDELHNEMARQGCGDIGDRVYTGHMICLDSARNIARLLIAIDQYGFPKRTMLVGLTLFHSLSAFIILFANVIQNPGDSYITEDVQLLGVILDSLFPSLQASGTFLPNLVSEIFSKMRLMAVEYVEKVQVQLKTVSKRPRRDSDEAVMHLPHRPATENHGQPHNKGLDSTADTYLTNARHNASHNRTEPTSLNETELPHELASRDSAWGSLYDGLDDPPTDEMPSEQNPLNENYSMGSLAESLPGSIPFIPWSLDFDLTDLWQFGKQDLVEGHFRE